MELKRHYGEFTKNQRPRCPGNRAASSVGLEGLSTTSYKEVRPGKSCHLSRPVSHPSGRIYPARLSQPSLSSRHCLPPWQALCADETPACWALLLNMQLGPLSPPFPTEPMGFPLPTLFLSKTHPLAFSATPLSSLMLPSETSSTDFCDIIIKFMLLSTLQTLTHF